MNINTPDYWDSVYRREGESQYVRHYEGLDEAVSRIVRSYIIPTTVGGVFADFGCGVSSTVSAITALNGVHYIGIDQSPVALERQAQIYPEHTWVCTQVDRTPLPDRSVSVAYSNSVVEHLDDPVALLAEMHRVLFWNGLFILGIPLHCPHEEHVRVYDWEECVKLILPWVPDRQFSAQYIGPDEEHPYGRALLWWPKG